MQENFLDSKHFNVFFLLLPEIHLLDFVGPAHVFHEANLLGASYTIKYIGISELVPSSIGVSLTGILDYRNVDIFQEDILIIPGVASMSYKSSFFSENRSELFKWLINQDTKGVRICGICTGSWILAESGILNNKKATTHWKLVRDFKEKHPTVHLVENAVFVQDKNIYTSAGITSAIDLALAIVDLQYSPVLSSQIAKEMILFLRRKGGDDQVSVHLQYRGHHRKEIHLFQDWLSGNLQKNPTLAEMAEFVAMSPRNFSRVCKSTIGISPVKYLEKLKIERAEFLLLNPSLSVSQVAEMSGFGSERQFRRIWAKSNRMSIPSFRNMA